MPEIPVLLWPELDEAEKSCEIAGRDFHHVCRVLRLRRGAELELRDGAGLVARGRLASVERDRARMEIVDCRRPLAGPAPCLHLALPLLKGRRLDWALEKGTELGAASFHLYISGYSVVRREKSPERYAELIAAAFCQSRRLFLPDLEGPRPFFELLDAARARGWRLWWADETLAGAGGEGPDFEVETPPGGTHLAWVGPEGGFSPAEREGLKEAGARALDLGPHRLRSETAALALACRFLLPGCGTFRTPR